MASSILTVNLPLPLRKNTTCSYFIHSGNLLSESVTCKQSEQGERSWNTGENPPRKYFVCVCSLFPNCGAEGYLGRMDFVFSFNAILFFYLFYLSVKSCANVPMLPKQFKLKMAAVLGTLYFYESRCRKVATKAASPLRRALLIARVAWCKTAFASRWCDLSQKVTLPSCPPQSKVNASQRRQGSAFPLRGPRHKDHPLCRRRSSWHLFWLWAAIIWTSCGRSL